MPSNERCAERSAIKAARLAAALLAVAVLTTPPISAEAQNFTPRVGANVAVAPSGSPLDIPQTNLVPIAPRSSEAFGGNSLSTIAPSLGMPSATATGSLFDPYSTSQAPGQFQPAMPPGSLMPNSPPGLAPGGGLFGGLYSQPASQPMPSGLNGPVYGAPIVNSPPVFGAPVYGTPPPMYGQPMPSPYGMPGGFGAPSFPSTAYPSGTPSTLFPGGLFGSVPFSGDANSAFSAYRFLQGPRLRHTFLGTGNDPTDLQINDTDVSVAFAFPNFLYSNQPLFVAPSFSLHLWDGPDSASGADLPGQAYSGFLDFGWQTDPNQMFGVELGVRVGAFTAFDTFRDESIRVLGKGLGSFRLTPASTVKLGVYYLDRNNWKLIPAGGLLWQPNPYTRFDIFFPQPKLAHYWRTIGTHDVWWYLAGDYGGGSWTIKRADGAADSVDINDFRAMAGLEWGLSDLIRGGRRTAFVEFGYVFERELKFKYNPADDISPGNAWMIRAGFGY